VGAGEKVPPGVGALAPRAQEGEPNGGRGGKEEFGRGGKKYEGFFFFNMVSKVAHRKPTPGKTTRPPKSCQGGGKGRGDKRRGKKNASKLTKMETRVGQ